MYNTGSSEKSKQTMPRKVGLKWNPRWTMMAEMGLFISIVSHGIRIIKDQFENSNEVNQTNNYSVYV